MNEKKPFILPADIRRKRIFWLLSLFFVFLLCLGMLLLVLLLNMVQPPGFGSAAPSPVANFQTSFYGPAEALLNRPTGVALSPSGELYVSDTGNARVIVLDRNGVMLRSITEFTLALDDSHADADSENGDVRRGWQSASYTTPIEDTPGAFVAPTALAFADDGRWFAVDQAQRVLLFFDAEDRLLQGVTFEEEEPISVDVNLVDEEEQLFVTTRSGILQGSLEGEFFSTYINWGLLSGQLDNPAAVVVFDPAHMSEEASISATDTVQLTIVADTLNNRVQAFKNFDTEPEVAWMFGRPILSPDAMEELDYEFENMILGYMSAPVDLALSPLGRLFVVDGLTSEIVVLNAQTGAYEYTVSSVGSRDGLLYYPSGVDYAQGNIYVVDRFNDRVSVFEDAPPSPADEVEEPVEAFNRWFLLALPAVAFLLALLRLLTLRMPRYVLDLSSLESLSEDDQMLMFIIEHFDNLTIVSGTESVAEKVLPGYDWKVEIAKEEKRDTLIEEYSGLNDLEAEALALALKKKSRSYLLTASSAVEHAGKEQEAKVVTFAEFRAVAQGIIAEESLTKEEAAAILKDDISPGEEAEKEAS
ncbi:MAG: NHL repeat-containing protein [Coriobacteriia bacterium]|nr:NHL repeat-containing protein [Coriobacteriia bacterium]